MKKQSSTDTDLERLRELAPKGVKVSRKAWPDPIDERCTLFRYTIIDSEARVYAFEHNCNKGIVAFIAATLGAMMYFDTKLVQLPGHLVVEFDKLEDDLEEVWRVFLIDLAHGRCVLEAVHSNPFEAAKKFWENPILPKIATVAARAIPSPELEMAQH